MTLDGVRVLVVEDEALVALFLEDLLSELGCVTAASAWRVAQAVDLAETVKADVAILDVNLAGERVYPVAHVLRSRGVPFVFATGYGAAGLPPDLLDCPVLTKPVSKAELEDALLSVMADD